MQTKFDVAQKDNQLALQQLTLLQRTRERNWLLVAAALLLLLSAAIFWGLRLRMRANRKIAEQNQSACGQGIGSAKHTNPRPIAQRRYPVGYCAGAGYFGKYSGAGGVREKL